MYSQSNSERPIVAVIVLYQRAPLESESFNSLIRVINADPNLADLFSLVLYDNSSERHDLPVIEGFPICYKHDPTNAGLATAFNFALAYAEDQQSPWLLLLDQDTSPTPAFFYELAECAKRLLACKEVSSIVPKLMVGGKVRSPEAHFIDQLRHQYRRSGHSLKHDAFGIQEGRPTAYNSGATFRVSTLREVGGFPEVFWLDYLDHAVFHALSSRGFQMYVMRTAIEHEISQSNLSNVPAWRQRNFLWAQTLFVEQTGNFIDRLLFRAWVLRYSRTLWINHPDRSLWKEALSHAFLLSIERLRPTKED
jgi:GT2 family glycosyltransferase